MNITDVEDNEDSHTVQLQYRSTSGIWQTSYLSTIWYDSSDSRWETNFTPSTSAQLGTYDVRIMVNDTDSGSSGWYTYNDIITVINNNPSLVNYTIGNYNLSRTNTTILEFNTTDIEDSSNNHTVVVQYRASSGAGKQIIFQQLDLIYQIVDGRLTLLQQLQQY